MQLVNWFVNLLVQLFGLSVQLVGAVDLSVQLVQLVQSVSQSVSQPVSQSVSQSVSAVS